MIVSRRNFIGGMASFAALQGCKSLTPSSALGAFGDPRLRLGVLSDIHLDVDGDEATLVKALEYFRDVGVDGVLVAGDIANTGRISQLKRFADAWFGVFPNDQAPNGRPVERLFILGNHCVGGWSWKSNAELRKDPSWAKREGIGFEGNRERVWRELFHEEFRPIWMKRVLGVPIVGAHWEERGDGVAIERFMKEHAKEIDPNLPFVYTQHAHPKDTCFGSWAWGHDDGRATRALSPFANAVAFSGHSHYTLTDERTVWQGAFTSINTSSLRYSSTDYSLRENIWCNTSGYRGEERPHRMLDETPNTDDGRQGMVVSFHDDHLRIERRDFVYDQSLGDDWIVPMPAANGTYSYAKRAARRAAPAFAAGAEVKVSVVKAKDAKDFTRVRLDFPAAKTVGKSRVFEYEATAILMADGLELVQAQRRMMSPDFHLPANKLVDATSFLFAAEDLPLKGRYRFEVRPVECFGGKGAAIASEPIELS